MSQNNRKKSPKGSVSVENFQGRLRLRWRFEGKRYALSIGLPDSLLLLYKEQKAFDAFKQIKSIPRSDCPKILKEVILKMISNDPGERFKEFYQAVDTLSNINVNIGLTRINDSYVRCIKSKSPEFSDEKFFEVFLSKLEKLSPEAHRKLDFKNEELYNDKEDDIINLIREFLPDTKKGEAFDRATDQLLNTIHIFTKSDIPKDKNTIESIKEILLQRLSE